MYEDYFKLREKPFSLLPDPGFMFWSQGHLTAYTMLEYGVLNNAGFTVITGGIGCGKTTLIRYLLSQFTEHVTVGLLSNTKIGDGDLLRWVMMALGQTFDQSSTIAVFRDFQQFLIKQYAAQRRTILIVDEAQNLGIDTLEELRMLSNINADKDQLLQVILVGQPELRELLMSPQLVQFLQRVSSEYHLRPLESQEVHDYITTRVVQAGGAADLFSHEATQLAAEFSKGTPRIINMLCDRALVYAFSSNTPGVSGAVMAKVIEDRERFGFSAR